MSRFRSSLIGLLTLLLAAATVAGLATPAAASAPAATPDKGPIGWDTYRRLDRLPELSTGVRTVQASSFDRTGGNGDWWQSAQACQRSFNGQCVIAEHSGAGEVDSIWFTWNGGDVTGVGDITITLDGRQIMHAPLQDVVDGKLGAPFVYPLVANADQSSGGVSISVPMPFRSSMLISTDGSSFYYHVTSRTFADDTGVSTFDPTDPAADVLATLTAAGTRDPKPVQPGARTTSTAVQLAPGATGTLAAPQGSGEVTALRVRLPQAQPVTPQVVTDDGRAFGTGGSSTFTIAVDPDNTGVRLTRRLDPSVANEVASVAVDGTVVARWGANQAFAGSAAAQRAAAHWPAGEQFAAAPRAAGQWAEEEVTLPAGVTAGKSQLTITNRFVSSDLDFNEFTYWADSQVGGGHTRTDTVDVGNAASESAHHYAITGQTWTGTRTYTEPLDATQLADLATAQELLQGLRIRIAFDGQSTVDSPLGEFYGTGFAVQPVTSLMFGVDPSTGWYSAWWPMPYLRGATVTLYNGSGIAVTGAQAEVTTAPDPGAVADLAQGRSGYFRTSSHAGPTTPDQDWTYLQATGSGKFVGNTVDMLGPASREYLEGDERVYTDGSKSPQIHGTGTEDYYEGGWYFNRGTYNTPLHGNPDHLLAGAGCPAGSDCTGAYRLMLADAVPFGSDISFGIEHGETDNIAANYSSTAYWYGTGQATVRQTDSLTVGDPGSETRHGYTSANPGQVNTLSETYEGVDGPQVLVTAATRSTYVKLTLKLALDPDNAGAVLQRTSDQLLGYQSAAVTVDGTALPDWVEPFANATHQWLDDTYQLPASVTAGHKSITVTLTPTPGAAPWSAASYQAFSVTG